MSTAARLSDHAIASAIQVLAEGARPLRVPADVLVYSTDEVTRWGQEPGTALYWALREGKVVHG